MQFPARMAASVEDAAFISRLHSWIAVAMQRQRRRQHTEVQQPRPSSVSHRVTGGWGKRGVERIVSAIYQRLFTTAIYR